MTAEERRDARAHRNRLAAQSSRDRKKAQYEQLSIRVNELEEENRALRMGITSTGVDRALEQENAQLRERIQNLEQAWQNMTKIIGAFAIPSTTQTTPKFDFPVSPTAPSLSVSDSTADASSEPTCEPAAGGPFSEIISPQIVIGTTTADWLGTTSVYDHTTAAASTLQPNEQQCLMPLIAPNSNPCYGDGLSEMDHLLGLLPHTEQLTLPEGVSIAHMNSSEWDWLNEGMF